MLNTIVVVLTAIYPVFVYFGLAHFKPGVFGIALALMLLVRLSGFEPGQRRSLSLFVVLLLVYAILVAITDSVQLLRFYPVLVNVLMLGVFATSLYSEQPVLERLARMRGMPVSEHGIPYLRNLTKIWCCFFFVNALIAAWTALYAQMSSWALYNGFVVYLIIGVLLLGEILFRSYYKRRFGVKEIAEK